MRKDRIMDRHDRQTTFDNESHTDDVSAHRAGASTGAGVFRLIDTNNIFGPASGGNDDITTGVDNFVAGDGAGVALTSGGENILIGKNAGANSIGSDNSVMIGTSAGRDDTSNDDCVFIGTEAGEFADGGDNIAIGYRALRCDIALSVSGGDNVAIGQTALENARFANDCVAISRDALNDNVRGDFCIAIGRGAQDKNIEGDHNISIGGFSLDELTEGTNNVAIGPFSLDSITTGTHNSVFGTSAGGNFTGNSNHNVCLGVSSGPVTLGEYTDEGYFDNHQTDTPLMHHKYDTHRVTINGDLFITGGLSKGAGAFDIEHPLDDSKRLRHGFIEGPEYGLLYRGKVKLVNGQATVDMDAESGMTPGTFEALAHNTTIYLQNLSGFCAVRPLEMKGAEFSIEAQAVDCDDEISWMVCAERKDKFVMESNSTDDEGHLLLEVEKGDKQE